MVAHSTKSNEELVASLQAEFDAIVFRELYSRFIPLFRSFSRSITIPGFELDDYYQEGKIAIHEAVEQYEKEREVLFAGYLRMIYRNKLYNLLRQTCAQKRGGTTRDSSLDSLVVNHGDGETSSGFDFIRDEQTISPELLVSVRERTTDYYIDLSDLEKSVLACYLDAMSIRETADYLGIKELQAKSAYDRCRQKLRNLL